MNTVHSTVVIQCQFSYTKAQKEGGGEVFAVNSTVLKIYFYNADFRGHLAYFGAVTTPKLWYFKSQTTI